MHSSFLRGSDFEMTVDGKTIAHAHFFADLSKQNRVGLIAPKRVDGVGAITLVMAYVTAFYDCYRLEDDDFFAYPDYFSFQTQSPVARYSYFDIWPNHKNVMVDLTHIERLNAITDRAIDVLIVPACEPTERTYERVQLECARRTIDRCYLYSFADELADADIMIECKKEPFIEWANSVFEMEGLSEDAEVTQMKDAWERWVALRPKLIQSFKRITLDEALLRL